MFPFERYKRISNTNGYQIQGKNAVMGKIIPKQKQPVTPAPIYPSAGTTAAYRRKLDGELKAMQADLLRYLRPTYKENSPEIMALDASPARELRAFMRKFARRWQARFNALAPALAEYFATAVNDRVDGELRRMLRKAGFTVQMQLTRTQNDVLQATIGENVDLIKSVAAQHLTQIQGIVMRSVQEGRDLGTLTKALTEQYGVARRRAETIARSQNNMATASLTRTRQVDLGITKAKWLHSAGGRTPRPEHVAFSGKTYEVAKGAWLEGKWTWPGRETNCRCVSIPIIPGLE
jgi:SPP1 gp7 family putative phage head morphogenesis protein